MFNLFYFEHPQLKQALEFSDTPTPTWVSNIPKEKIPKSFFCRMEHPHYFRQLDIRIPAVYELVRGEMKY